MIHRCFKTIIILFLISAFSYPTFSESPKVTDGIHHFYENYDFDGLADFLNRTLEETTLEQDPELYMEALLHLTYLEMRYEKIDQMILNAIRLNQLANEYGDCELNVLSTFVLAYYDYYHFLNQRMSDKLNAMLLMEPCDLESEKEFLFYNGAALLAIDQSAFEDAIYYYQLALEVQPHLKSYVLANEPTQIHSNIARVHSYAKDFPQAIRSMETALSLVDPRNSEKLCEYHFSISKYYFLNGDLDQAEKHIDLSKSYHALGSNLFKEYFTEAGLLSMKAAIAFERKDYELAANLYHEFYGISDYGLYDNLENIIAAREAADSYELSGIENQISLLQKLDEEKLKRLKVQEESLKFAHTTIALLTVVLMGILIFIRYQFKQRRLLYKLSITDQLTDLFNRTYIIDQFDQLKSKTKCIALIDLDDFKSINDTYGHVVGDYVLKRVAQTIKQTIRESDLAGRYGGEEFMLIINTDQPSTAISVVERVRTSVEELKWDYPDLKTTLSAGLVISQLYDGDLLLSKADDLLYQAKNEGKNKVIFSQF